jgi:hypothetical protein
MYSKTKYAGGIAKGIKLLLVVGALCVTTSLAAANLTERINVSGKDITVLELLNQIEQQTDYTFAFNKSDFDTSRRINIDAKQVKVEDVLKAILDGTQLFYTLNGNQVIIFMVKEATPEQKEKAATDAPQKRMTVIATAPTASAPAKVAPAPKKAAPAAAPVKAVSTPAPVAVPVSVAPATAPAKVESAPAPVVSAPVASAPAKVTPAPLPVKDEGELVILGALSVKGSDNLHHGTALPADDEIVKTIEQTPDLATAIENNPAIQPYIIKKPAMSDLLPNLPVSPLFALKTNLLLDVTTTMNLGFEVRVSPKSTIELTGSYNPWSWKDNRKWKSILVQPEYRWWVGDPFAGHFIGTHIQWGHYNFGNLPVGDLDDNRFQGDLYSVGFSYGYSWYIGKRWALEATLGLGYNYLEYEKFDCIVCGNSQGWRTHSYFGITKLGLNLSFLIK